MNEWLISVVNECLPRLKFAWFDNRLFNDEIPPVFISDIPKSAAQLFITILSFLNILKLMGLILITAVNGVLSL